MKRIRRFSEEYFRAIAPACEERLLSSETDEDIMPPHVFSEEFNSRMDDVFRVAEKHKRAMSRKTKIVIAVAAVLIAAMFAAFSVGASREGVYQMFFLERDYSHAVVQFQTDEDVPQPLPTEDECVYLPQYMPEGYEVEMAVYDQLSCWTVYNVDGKHCYFSQFDLNTPVDFDVQNCKTYTTKINGYDVFFSVKWGELIAIWSNNEYCFLLSGYISEEEAVKVIESVEETDIVREVITGKHGYGC